VKRLIDVRLNNISQLAGFAKKEDLKFFSQELCNAQYSHLPDLAPTQEMLSAYRKEGKDWKIYEDRFIQLLRDRHIESMDKDLFKDSCLLCSESKSHYCHRRLVAEYLKCHWGDVDIIHL